MDAVRGYVSADACATLERAYTFAAEAHHHHGRPAA